MPTPTRLTALTQLTRQLDQSWRETTVAIIQPIVLTSPAGVPFVTQSGALLVRGTRNVTPQE